MIFLILSWYDTIRCGMVWYDLIFSISSFIVVAVIIVPCNSAPFHLPLPSFPGGLSGGRFTHPFFISSFTVDWKDPHMKITTTDILPYLVSFQISLLPLPLPLPPFSFSPFCVCVSVTTFHVILLPVLYSRRFSKNVNVNILRNAR